MIARKLKLLQKEECLLVQEKRMAKRLLHLQGGGYIALLPLLTATVLSFLGLALIVHVTPLASAQAENNNNPWSCSRTSLEGGMSIMIINVQCIIVCEHMNLRYLLIIFFS